MEDITIIGRLGNGANGEVSKCSIKGKKYAIKRVFNDWVQTENERHQYKQDIYDELENCEKMIGKKRLMQVVGVCEDNDDYYIISELLDNEGCLNDYLNKNHLGLYDRLLIFKSILLSVQQLHSLNIVHADLKTENMVYYYDKKINTRYVKLIDFNTTYKINDNDEYDIPFAHGTYGYCAIEQHKNRLNLKSDIYSLGVILLELIVNNDLWDININNYQKYRKSILENLKKVNNIPLKLLIKKCISVKSNLRYDITELVKEYNIIIDGMNGNNGHKHKMCH